MNVSSRSLKTDTEDVVVTAVAKREQKFFVRQTPHPMGDSNKDTRTNIVLVSLTMILGLTC